MIRYRDAILPVETQFTRFSTTGSTPSLEKTATEWQTDFLRPDRLQMGAFQGDRMVGYLKFKQPYPDHVGFRHVADFGIMIFREFWQQSLARIMMNEMELYARSIGVQRFEARVRDGNARAMKIFESLGFKNEGTRKGAAKVSDQMVDEFYIGKIF